MTVDASPPSPSDPRDPFRDRAKYLVESNAECYPELLIEQIAAADYEATVAATHATYLREMVVVSLRMLHRAGKLKPTTDDELAAIELASNMLDLPAAQRRLLHPLTPNYVEEAVVAGQLALNINSQESVNTEAA